VIGEQQEYFFTSSKPIRSKKSKLSKKSHPKTNPFPEGRVIIDTSFPDHSIHPVEDHSNWMDLSRYWRRNFKGSSS
jgi:hypothetical protein